MKKFAILLAGLAIFVFFFGLDSYGLIDPDEGRYAEISREMLESGDFITPKLNYVKYFEKPALHYWLTAGVFALFGQNEFAARLTPVLFGLLGALVTFWTAKRLWGLRAGVYAAVILSTSLLWFAVARLNILDMAVSFFITLAVAGFLQGTRNESARDRRYLLLFYVGMALATLSKGLIGLVLPGGIAFWYIVFSRRWRLFLRTLYVPGVILFFLISVPWFWMVCRANGDFFYFFFIQEHLLRYTTRLHDRYEPFWYFIPVLIGGLLPWAGLLPGMFRLMFSASGSPEEEEAPSGPVSSYFSRVFESVFHKKNRGSGASGKNFRSSGLFPAVWFAVPFLFFSLSDSKLVPYIVPCLPPLAILGGRLLALIADGNEKNARHFAALNGVLLILPAIAGVVYPFVDKKLGPSVLLPLTLPATATLLLMALCGWWFCRGKSYRTMINALCVLAFVNALVFSQGFVLKAELDSRREIAGIIREQAKPGDLVVGYRDLVQGLGFYLQRRIVLAEARGELSFGAAQEADPRWFIDAKALESLWRGEQRVFLVADRRRAGELERLLNGNLKQAGGTRAETVFVNF